MTGYDEKYAGCDSYFGSEPDTALKRFHHLLPKPGPILDIGAGQGRNALFLARQGYEIHTVEPSKVAFNALTTAAEREGLPVKTYNCGYETFHAQAGAYPGILLFGVVMEQPWETLPGLIDKIRLWIAREGLVLVNAFTMEDPQYQERRGLWQRVGGRSFIGDDREVKTYLEAGEILELFRGFETVHHREGLGPEHRHGDGPLERHGRAEAVLRYPGD